MFFPERGDAFASGDEAGCIVLPDRRVDAVCVGRMGGDNGRAGDGAEEDGGGGGKLPGVDDLLPVGGASTGNVPLGPAIVA